MGQVRACHDDFVSWQPERGGLVVVLRKKRPIAWSAKIMFSSIELTKRLELEAGVSNGGGADFRFYYSLEAVVEPTRPIQP